MNLDWDDLRVFLAISEQGNLSAASRELKVSQPTVGRRLKSLEESLGTQLFDRLPDGLALTNHGEQLVPLARNMETAADAVWRQQASFTNEVKGTVRISMYEQIAQFFMQHLPALQKRCNQIEIELSIAHNAANLSRREADLLIRECLPDIPDIIAKKLGHYHYAVYGSKYYIDTHPSALTERRYEDCDWVGFDDEHTGFFGQQWLREKLAKRKPVVRSNNGVVLLDAMLKGAGIGVLPCFVGDQESQLQRLEVVPGDGPTLYLLVHKDMRKSPAVRLMMDSVTGLFAEYNDILHGAHTHRHSPGSHSHR
ncbi:MAG: LysR family transcriptional regulator [Acidiferrobacterales bacterium]|nr:LysR family transcriptional regulator [Acidiferrobacterales bacterium]